MSADLAMFMRWLGLLEAPKATQRHKMGEWFKGEEVPF